MGHCDIIMPVKSAIPVYSGLQERCRKNVSVRAKSAIPVSTALAKRQYKESVDELTKSSASLTVCQERQQTNVSVPTKSTIPVFAALRNGYVRTKVNPTVIILAVAEFFC